MIRPGPVPIPTLQTARLVLRPPALADYPEFRTIMQSDRARYMGGPFDDWGAWGMFCHDIAGWSIFGHGALMIERASDGRCIGEVNINHGPLFPEKELGWMLYEGHEGHGYATEAAAAYRDWAFAELGLATLVSYCHPDNRRSIAVAERLGATRDDNAPREDPEDVVMRHLPAARAP
jgi:RimJ/RimL family protein N-acetyltransferase